MTRTLILLSALVALLASACGGDDTVATGSAAPAGGTSAAPADDGGGAGTELTVVVTGGEFDRLTYTISCGDEPSLEPPVDGLDAATACQRLSDPAVASRLVEGPPPDQMCTEIYGGPQEAAITGTIEGRPVDATITRVNGCEIDTWDRVLAGVLPPTQGVQGG